MEMHPSSMYPTREEIRALLVRTIVGSSVTAEVPDPVTAPLASLAQWLAYAYDGMCPDKTTPERILIGRSAEDLYVYTWKCRVCHTRGMSELDAGNLPIIVPDLVVGIGLREEIIQDVAVAMADQFVTNHFVSK